MYTSCIHVFCKEFQHLPVFCMQNCLRWFSTKINLMSKQTVILSRIHPADHSLYPYGKISGLSLFLHVMLGSSLIASEFTKTKARRQNTAYRLRIKYHKIHLLKCVHHSGTIWETKLPFKAAPQFWKILILNTALATSPQKSVCMVLPQSHTEPSTPAY